ncbi:type IV secretory pathway VirB10-like protein [Bradyrhizobium sp. USDA 4518]
MASSSLDEGPYSCNASESTKPDIQSQIRRYLVAFSHAALQSHGCSLGAREGCEEKSHQQLVRFTAQVTENVFDTPTGRFLLVPQGARLIGIYDSQVTFGQSRVLLVWTRLIMPNGRSIVLERQPGADAAGYAGLEDQVDNHWGELFKAAALSTFLAVGTELGAGSDTNSNDSAIIQALRHGASDSLNQTGQQVVRRSLNIQPTLTVRPGFPVRVLVNRDLILVPYGG